MTDHFASTQATGMVTVFRTQRPLLCAIAALTVLIMLLLPLCSRLLPDLPPPCSTAVLAVCELLLLAAALCLGWCVILFFRKRPLLRVSQKGVWFRLSRKQQGHISWNHIAQVSLAPDGATLQLQLCGLPELNEQLSTVSGPGGRRILTLPLRGKVRDPQQVCALLQQYRDRFTTCPVDAFPLPEADIQAQRQRAAIERKGLFILLTAARFLSSKLWILWCALYLFTSGLTADVLQLPQWEGLLICLLPFLLTGLWLRRALSRAIAAMEAAIQAREQQSSGL